MNQTESHRFDPAMKRFFDQKDSMEVQDTSFERKTQNTSKQFNQITRNLQLLRWILLIAAIHWSDSIESTGLKALLSKALTAAASNEPRNIADR